MRLAAHYVASFVLFLRRLDVETYPCLKPSAALTPSPPPGLLCSAVVVWHRDFIGQRGQVRNMQHLGSRRLQIMQGTDEKKERQHSNDSDFSCFSKMPEIGVEKISTCQNQRMRKYGGEVGYTTRNLRECRKCHDI